MNSTTSYTPLETLLLFQSLVAYGIEDQNFIQISDHLTNNPLIKDGETYDAQRLTADALRELFLQLLRDELRAEDQEDGSPTATKKRKLQSPPPPSIKDAQEHRDRLPILVDRLYARYRDYMVRAIEDDERRYVATQKEIDEIERGEWDERILIEEKAMTNGNGTVSAEDSQPKTNGISTEPLPEEKATEPTTEVSKEQPRAPSPVLSPPTEVRPEGLGINDVLNNQETPPPLLLVDGSGSNRMLHHINLLRIHPTDHTPNSILRNIPLKAIPLHQGDPSLLHTACLPRILMYHRLQLINNTLTLLYCLHPIQQQYACLQTHLACL
jgi:hypothetical protein